MAHPQACSRDNGAMGKMLIQPTDIHNTGHRRMIWQEHLTLRRKKNNGRDRMVEMLWNCQRLHIADPAPATGMDGIANLVVALQHKDTHAPLCRRLCRRQARRSTTHN